MILYIFHRADGLDPSRPDATDPRARPVRPPPATRTASATRPSTSSVTIAAASVT
jgi:hypothetical protein